MAAQKKDKKKATSQKKTAEAKPHKGGAPKGNQFWRQRSKHGRDKLFATPDLMLDAAFEYFAWCDANPWIKNDVVKGGEMAGTPLMIPTQRPYTLSGLCLYLGCNQGYFRTFKSQLPEGEQDFNAVITCIEEIIETQQFEGATVGAFNANIIARKLGLSDKQDQNVNASIQINIDSDDAQLGEM